MLMFVLIVQQLFSLTLDQLITSIYLVVSIALILVGLNFILQRIASKRIDKSYNKISYLFAQGSLTLLILIGAEKLFHENTAIDLQLHDTYFVIAPLHISFLMSFILGIWAIIYYMSTRIIKKKLNLTLGEIHFWTTFYGVLFIQISMQLIGMSTFPGRYYGFYNFRLLNSSITILALILLMSQLVYFVNLFYSLAKGQKVN